MNIIDRTAQSAGHTVNRSGIPILSRAGSRRPIGAINAIMLHQMSFHRGSGRDQFDAVIAHYAVLLTGDVLLLRPHQALLNDALARTCIHVEFEGNFPSELGQEGRDTPSSQQILVGRQLIVNVRNQIPAVGRVYAHRQVSELSRPNCPGPHIWRNVGDWAVRTLGFLDRPPQQRREIPDSWRDARYALVD